jgi:hypothetical protein
VAIFLFQEVIMPRHKSRYNTGKVRGNFGPGGVTGLPFEDDYDLNDLKFSPEKGEMSYNHHPDRSAPPRDADLSVGSSGTSWNTGIGANQNFSGTAPKGWKLSDEKLKQRVSEVLLHSHDVDPTDMEVEVKDRVVYLKGAIKSRGMKIVAIDLVGSIPGVEDVFTELKVRES